MSFDVMNCSTIATTNMTSNDGNDEMMIELPIVVSYLILLFRIISTLYITVIGIAVIIVVIKNKKDFQGRHVSLIVNLMVSGMLSALNATVQSSIMIISYIAGVNDPIRCDILFATLSSFHISAFALLMLSVDKFIAIVKPLQYISLVTNRVAYSMIFLSWIVSIIIGIARIFTGERYRNSSQYGVCIPEQESFVTVMITFITPIFVSLLAAVIIDIYSSISVCKVNKQFHQHCEGLQVTTPPYGTSDKGILAKLRQRINRYNIKPIVAVLIGLVSNGLLGLVCPILFITAQTLEISVSYRFVVENIIIPNAAYGFLIAYSIIYSMYYTSIRRPLYVMMKQLVRAVCPMCVRWRRWLRRKLGRRNQIVPAQGK